ncbi:MAG: FAD-dependent oxidoreductase, partial [Clostridia bacterium]|nr:FAD-dependent oxidoreductase [Clostridia bacterium]
GPRYELLTRGTFLDFYRQVGGTIFDVEEAKAVLAGMVARYPNLAVSLNTTFKELIIEDNELVGIKAIRNGQELNFYGRRFIDATQDADLATAAGVPYTLGAEDIGEKDRFQAVTLVFQLGDIDWQALERAVKGGQIKDAKISARAAWGFNSIAANYRPTTERVRLRGLNIARQNDGTVMINALHIFGIDGLSAASRAEAMELAKAELPAIVEFLMAQMPGFASARLLATAPELYIRETRHIEALYQLDINDVVFNRYFDDAIALASYPVDVQATSPYDAGYVYGNPKVYSIPFRSLVPQVINNLLVVGRSAGFTHLAAGSARVVPIGMACGDAAGVSAYYSLTVDKNFHELAVSSEDIKAIQALIVKTGGYLKDYKLSNPLEGHWAFAGLEFVNRWGLIVPGYDNDWKLEEPIKRIRFYYMTANALQRALGRHDLVQAKAGALSSYLETSDLTRAEAARLLLTYLDEDVAKLDGAGIVAAAAARGLLPIEHTGSEPYEVITGAEAYYATERLCALLKEVEEVEEVEGK